MAEAELIIGLCDRFHCLPSQLLAEDADIIKLVKIADLGRGDEKEVAE